ncbi:MAG: trypsin-like peptidase domain-containing protein [Chitinophagaceae bacterium]|nr:trypsin-like peptidase domain-containing protein [Chitinophagaceae bacterium]
MILGKDTMLPINFLEKASSCSRAVGRIVTIHSTQSVMATGFMISEELLVTCNHVIPDIATAENCSFQIDYFIRGDGTFNQYHEFKLNASNFFATSIELDVTVVAIKPANKINFKERNITNLQLSNLVKGESVNIIHHALGEPQKISMRNGEVVAFSDTFIHYDTPTSPGSAGAPVFNDQWELIAIHHAGGFLKPLDESSVQIRLNEGIRISAFMAWFDTVSNNSSQNRILKTQIASRKKNHTEPDLLTSREQIEEEKEKRDSVFISYAHKDQEKVEWQVELDKYIKNVSTIGSTRVWYDERIKVGTEWRAEIESALKKTKVAVLLVGPYFLNSGFIVNNELPNLLEAAKNEGVIIIPLITHRVPYNRSILGKFQSFNSPDNPLQEQRKNDAIKTLNELVEEIAKVYDVK